MTENNRNASVGSSGGDRRTNFNRNPRTSTPGRSFHRNSSSTATHHVRSSSPATTHTHNKSLPTRTYTATRKTPLHRTHSPNTNIPSSQTKIMRKGLTGRRPPEPRKAPKIRSKIPEIEEGVLRIIPLGGVEQIGQNMTAIEYGNDIIIVDAGIQFAEQDHPGIDYIIPNSSYVEERKEKIRGLFITHGHLDHVGAIPFLINSIGNPEIYSREFGAMMILKRHEEFPHLPKIKMNIVNNDTVVRAGDHFVVKSFAISHTIPDSMGLIIETPLGEIVFIEDVRVDNIKGIPSEEEKQQYKRFQEKEALMLTMDSTSIWKAGWSLSENTVAENIEKIMQNVSGRLIVATFASQVERIAAIIDFAEKSGKKIAVDGRSMKTNIEIAKQLGIITAKNIIPLEDIGNYPPHKIVMIVTGGQGEEFAALARMANKSHRQLSLQPTDTILLSSSVIPGNEGDIDKLKDNLYRSDAKIITYTDSDVHASGHGNREELRWIHEQIKYRFFMPVHGNHWMLCQHAELSQSLGTPKENTVVPDNGSIIEIYNGGKSIRMRKEKAPSDLRMVDGFAVGDVQEVVIRDRQLLAEDGMFVVFAIVDSKTGKLKKSPDIISRGFIYLKESQELLHQARTLIKKTVESGTEGQNPINFDIVKSGLADALSKFLLQKTAKRPLVIPVLLSV